MLLNVPAHKPLCDDTLDNYVIALAVINKMKIVSG